MVMALVVMARSGRGGGGVRALGEESVSNQHNA